MMKALENAKWQINLGQNLIQSETLVFENQGNVAVAEWDNAETQTRIRLSLEEAGAVSYMRIAFVQEQSDFRDSLSLEAQNPLQLDFLPAEKPHKILALYQHRDWWTRPAFVEQWAEVPARTQSLLVQYDHNHFGYYLPLGLSQMKGYLSGSEQGGLRLSLTAYTAGIVQGEEIGLLYGEGKEISALISSLWQFAAKLLKVPLKDQRAFPELFSSLGFCTWDAFYTEMDQGKILAKAEEFAQKQVPVNWYLLDDGWLSIAEQRLTALEPDRTKFPEGLAQVTKKLKTIGRIKSVGVWHALGGYWGGIHPTGGLGQELKEYLYFTKNQKALPHYLPEKGFGFWRRWYKYLRDEGIDFVKVDGQSALKNYYQQEVDIATAARGTHEALEAAAAIYFNSQMINCMGMASENLFSRPHSALARNSDDFLPKDRASFAEHILQNAYNGLYHQELYHCDWDMFWTCHPDAPKHALLRAISGGPIYISDPLGQTNPEILKPLVYAQGEILRMERTALPTPESIFVSPLETDQIVLTNRYRGTGAAAAFHLGQKDSHPPLAVSAGDIEGLSGEHFLVYDHQDRGVEILNKVEPASFSLGHEGWALKLFIPYEEGIIPIGLVDKYMSCHSLVAVRRTSQGCSLRLRCGGEFAFYSTSTITSVTIAGEECQSKLVQKDNLYFLDLSAFDGEINLEIRRAKA